MSRGHGAQLGQHCPRSLMLQTVPLGGKPFGTANGVRPPYCAAHGADVFRGMRKVQDSRCIGTMIVDEALDPDRTIVDSNDLASGFNWMGVARNSTPTPTP